MDRFPFRFEDRYTAVLRVLGITPTTAAVDIEDGRLLARFGRWRVETTLDNVCETQITSGYTALRAIGTHLSLKDRGLSFGTNIDRGLCICFKAPVKGMEPFGLIKHPALTVTVEDVEGLAAKLGT